MKVSKQLFAVVLVAGLASLFGVTALNNTSKNKDVITLSKDNTVILSGEISGETAATVIADARAKSQNKKSIFGKRPLYLFLNTPGGSIQTGLEIIEALNGLRVPISTVTLFSASMGFQLVQAFGERLILRNGVLMSHRAAGEFSGSFGGQRPSQVDSRYGFWMSRVQELDEQTVARTNGKQTMESYQKAYADELWLTGSQAVKEGYADRVVTVSCDDSLNGTSTHTVNFLGVALAYDLDNCPLNTSPMKVRISDNERKRTGISEERFREIKSKFLELFRNKQSAVVYTYW